MAGNFKQVLPEESVDLTAVVEVIKLAATPAYNLSNKVAATSKEVHWREVALDTTLIAPSMEGADAGDGATHGRTGMVNNCMILAGDFMISGTMGAVDVDGVSSEVEFETDLKLKELMLAVEHYAINGVLANEAGTTPSQANGLLNLISQANHQDLAGVDLTENHLNTAMEMMYQWGVDTSEEKVCFVNSATKKTLNALFVANKTGIFESGSGKEIGLTADRIVSDWGTARIVLDEKMPNKTIAFVTPSYWETATLRPFTRNALGKTGDGDKYQIVGEISFKLLNQYAGAVIANIK